MPYKSLYFFVTTEPKSDGVFAEMQIINYTFIIPKHIQINFQFRKLLYTESQIVIFFWDRQSVDSWSMQCKLEFPNLFFFVDGLTFLIKISSRAMNIYGTITPYETVLCVMMTFQLIFRISFHVIGNIGFILYGKFFNFCMKIMLQE